MQLPPIQFLPNYASLPASQHPSAAWSTSQLLQPQARLRPLQNVQPGRLLGKLRYIVRPTAALHQQPSRMPKEWGTPERNDFEHFLHRSVSNQETPKREIERVPDRTAKSATPSPMPKPKIKSEFVAWGEYTGNGKDEDFIAWKKRQLGEADPVNKNWTTRNQNSRSQFADRAKENEAPSTSPQSLTSTNQQNKKTQRKPSSGKNAMKKGQI